jgi:hypothetical protein
VGITRSTAILAHPGAASHVPTAEAVSAGTGVDDLGHTYFAVMRINLMPPGEIIAQMRETHFSHHRQRQSDRDDGKTGDRP